MEEDQRRQQQQAQQQQQQQAQQQQQQQAQQQQHTQQQEAQQAQQQEAQQQQQQQAQQANTGGEVQTYQIITIPTSSSLPQSGVLIPLVGLCQSQTDEPTLKREIRLAKNREAAQECRRKKKEYVKCLESRVATLEGQNMALIKELRSYKDLHCVKT